MAPLFKRNFAFEIKSMQVGRFGRLFRKKSRAPKIVVKELPQNSVYHDPRYFGGQGTK